MIMQKTFAYMTTGLTALFMPVLAVAAETAHGDNSHGAEADHATSSGGLPQFDATTFPSQLFWLFVTFTVCYLVFAKKILPEISTIIHTRKERIDNDLQTAKELKEEIENVRHEYEAAIADARVKASTEMQAIQAQSRTEAEQAAKSFNDHAAEKIAEVEKNAEGMKTKIMNDMRVIVAESAADIVNKITDCTVDQTEALDALDRKLGQNKKAA